VNEPVPRRLTAQAAALAGLRWQIRAGVLAPGQRIDQRKAAESFECSIVPVREALKTLEAEGQVSYSPQRGYFVAALDPQELRETFRIRTLLEDEAANVAIANVDASTLRVLELLLAEAEEAAAAGLVPEMIAADRRFHFTLFVASGMHKLVGLIRMLWDSTDRYRAQYYLDPANRERVSTDHRAVLDALTRRDADGVLQVLRAAREHIAGCISEHVGAAASNDGARPVDAARVAAER
jgi:DNA-binding GntR family transcriptional regulator